MRTVWKFLLELADEQEVLIPRGASPLAVAAQEDGWGNTHIVLWCLVDSLDAPKKWRIRVAGTGHQINDNFGVDEYIGTALSRTARTSMDGGRLVWHIFGRRVE